MTNRSPAVLCAALACLAVALLTASAAVPGAALAQSPVWRLNSTAAPTFLPGTGEAQLVVSASNLGDAEVNASHEDDVTLTDELPPGVKPRSTRDVSDLANCSIDQQTVSCAFKGTLPAYQALVVDIVVEMEEPQDTSLFNIVKVKGGDTPPSQPLSKRLDLSQAETPFGVETYKLTPESEPSGEEDPSSGGTQAGSHPFQLTTLLDFNQTLEHYGPGAGNGAWPSAPALPRNLHIKLPPGLLGDPSAVPQCSATDFSTVAPVGDLCPPETAVGVAIATIYDPKVIKLDTFAVPVFNLEPAPGEPARLGFVVENVPVILKTSVPSGGDYAVEVSVDDLSQAVQILSSEVSIWGVPGASSHDPSRGWTCLKPTPGESCEPLTSSSTTAFLTLPTSCQAPPQTSVSGESWSIGQERPGVPLQGQTTYTLLQALTGCETLAFDPSIAIEPESHSASTPTGLDVGVQMPQTGLLAPEGDAESALEQTTVKLPSGLQLNPSAANALEDCTAREFDFLNQFGDPFEDPEEEQQTANETFPSGPAGCPDAAKVGTVSIATPLLNHELIGSVYLAAQNTNPFRSPLALYLLAEDPADGIRVKLAGTVEPDPTTGQLTSTFRNTPQLPFTALKLHLFGGERASVSTPSTCGPATTTSEFVPWSGESPATPSSTFQVTSGVGGGPCPPSPLPFGPGFSAGVDGTQAGAYSPLRFDVGRPDGDQALSGIVLGLPPGEAAMLSHATPCSEPPAGQEWSCGAASLLGHAKEAAGLGGEPVMLTGEVFLTSGYDGAPFGVLVRTHAAAGPFDLGIVNVRSRIDVDPHTAAATITTDPGPRDEAIPTILNGVPVQLKALEVLVDRPEFAFNPTNCSPMSITGALDGSEGAVDPLSYPFNASNCAGLPFKPSFTAGTTGHASKADGASLVVRVTSAGLGQANIAKTTVTLPKALPSRLTTIQKACLASVFEANPASCPEGSNVGSATIHTPIFNNPLSGPAYLVSYGGAAFPDVEFVLQGEGVKIVLDGQTDIKKGVTTATFDAVPDAPFTSFETVLPTGPHSALTANVAESKKYSLCGEKLTMPTVITGQNGKVIEQTTKIQIQGCGAVKSAKVKKLTRKQKLALALKACRKQHKHSRKRRVACEKQARGRYAAKKVAHHKTKPVTVGQKKKKEA